MPKLTKTPLFSRKQSGGMFSVVDETTITGSIFWVDSGKASDGGKDESGYGLNPNSPFVTLDYAINQCEANSHDHIILMSGHAETLTTAGAVAIDVAGITIWGLGQGSDRPTFTFSSTDNSASILITGANTVIKNIVGVCGDDGLTNPFHVQAADCDLDIEWQDGSTSVEAAAAILTTADADRLNVKLKYVGFTGGSGCANAIRLVGGSQTRIDIDFYGKATTAVVEFHTTAVVDCNVTGYMYNTGTTNFTKSVVDTKTGSTWFAAFYDGAAGSFVSGGSGDALAAGDLSDISTAVVTTIPGLHAVPTKSATVDVNMRDVIGKKDEDALDDVAANKSIIAYVKGILNKTRVREATGDADIDFSEADYTNFHNLITVTAPATGLLSCVIDLDFNKDTTGWDTDATAADTLDVILLKQIDGTNYRASQKESAQITATGAGTLAVENSGVSFDVGPMQANCSVQIHVKVSAERGDAVIPYRVTSVGAAPTITAVAAA